MVEDLQLCGRFSTSIWIARCSRACLYLRLRRNAGINVHPTQLGNEKTQI